MRELIGIVKKWIDERGFGFIELHDHREVFVHISMVRECLGVERLDPGMRVAIDTGTGGHDQRLRVVAIEMV